MAIRNVCFNLYWKLQRVIAPSLKYSQSIFEDVLMRHSNNVRSWLDLGCGHELLPHWRLEQEHVLASRPKLIVGLDYDHDSLKKHRTIKNLIRGNLSYLPFPKESFDFVTSNMVFEHLKDPEGQLQEIFRILKPGGSLVFHTPNCLGYATILGRLIPESIKSRVIWFLEQRKEEDVFPTYYRINSEKRIRNLAQRTGFEIEQLHLILSTAVTIMVPPLVIFELLLIRILMTPLARGLRTNIIAILKKPGKVPPSE